MAVEDKAMPAPTTAAADHGRPVQCAAVASAAAAGFEAYVIEDACRAIDMGGSLGNAWRAMGEANVGRTGSHALEARA